MKDKQIKDLKEENLSSKINYLEKKKNVKKNMDVAEDLYSKKIIEEDTFDDLQDTYEFSENHDYEREKDDFEMDI